MSHDPAKTPDEHEADTHAQAPQDGDDAQHAQAHDETEATASTRPESAEAGDVDLNDNVQTGEQSGPVTQTHKAAGDESTWTFTLEDPPATGTPEPSLDNCPNCKAAVDDEMQMVCLHCGYNLRTMQVEKTLEGVQEQDPGLDAHDRANNKPLSPDGRGGSVLALSIAAVCVVALLAAALAGHHGLFASAVNAHEGDAANFVVPWGARISGLLRLTVGVGTWSIVCFASLWLFARVMEQPLGDVNLALARSLGLACSMKLASLIPVTMQAVRFPLEAIAQFAILFGLSVLLFRMQPRTAGFFALVTAMVLLITYLASMLIVWSLG